MGDIFNKFEDMSIGFINIVSVLSGLVTILAGVVSVFAFFRGDFSSSCGIITALLAAIFLNFILFFRNRKIRNLEQFRMKQVTHNMHNLLHNVRDVYFDIMNSHKNRSLTEPLLSVIYKRELTSILDNLCTVMKSYTGQEISACIKLITYRDSKDIVDVQNEKLVTFCRSSNSDRARKDYESPQNPIVLKENTDFVEVVSKDYEKGYFYQSNLVEYDKALKKIGKKYNNSNNEWKKFYRGTIVVPIRIQSNKLYHIEPSDTYHIIGFLCVDSMATGAFSKRQERYNVDMVYAYADVIYILLGQYCHYLRKFEEDKAVKGAN